MAEQSDLIITYIDGKTKKFRIPRIQGTRTHLGEMIDRARTSTSLMLEADGVLMLIPFANVRHVELKPAPDSQPIPGLITGAKALR